MITKSDSVIDTDRTHGGDVSDGILDFSVSINPLGPPPGAIDAYHRAASEIINYPPPYARGLETKIGHWLKVDPECVLAGNGTTQLIYLVARVITPRKPFVVIPTFSEIANALIAASSKPHAIRLDPRDHFRFDRSAISLALSRGADAIFVGRPNSPTGNMLSYDDALSVAREASHHGAWCIFDEAFIDFVSDGRSIVDAAAQDPRVIVFRSLTKTFAIPGLRLGCAISHPDTVRTLRDGLEPWSVSVTAQQVGSACMEDATDFVRNTQAFIAQERSRLVAHLAAHPQIQCFDSIANFVMIRIKDEAAATDLIHHLMEHRIAIRDLRSLPGAGPGFYRIGLRNRSDNDLLIDAIRNWKWPA